MAGPKSPTFQNPKRGAPTPAPPVAVVICSGQVPCVSKKENKHGPPARIISKNAVNWGFYDVPNDGQGVREWPEKAVIDRASKAHNPAVFAWRAVVSNNGPTTVLDVTIPVKLWFENEKPEVIYKAIVTPLVPGARFTFYLVNDCPKSVAAAWPDTATLQVLGESLRREVPLRRTYRSPIDQIMVFFPSSTTLVGDHQCE